MHTMTKLAAAELADVNYVMNSSGLGVVLKQLVLTLRQ